MKKVLFIGPLSTNHILRLITKVSEAGKSELDVHVFDWSINKHNQYVTDLFTYHSIRMNSFREALVNLPKIGVAFRILLDVLFLWRLYRKERFQTMVTVFIPIETFLYAKIAHHFKCKTTLVALGSDILRVNSLTTIFQRIAFKETNFVAASKEYTFSKTLIKKFNIPESKCVYLRFGSDAITLINELKGKTDRQFMQKELGLPYSKYNIVCGYNASSGQRQEAIIKAFIANKDLLPNDYLVIVPLTYGFEKEYIISKLKQIPGFNTLRVVCLTEYMTAKQVAYLRLITDLFVHIQTTDAYNASLQEFLLAGAQCINGKWLEYESLEHNGVPYHILEHPNLLSRFISMWFKKEIEPKTVSEECVRTILRGKDWSYLLPLWIKHLEIN